MLFYVVAQGICFRGHAIYVFSNYMVAKSRKIIFFGHSCYRRIFLVKKSLLRNLLRLHYALQGGTKISRKANISPNAILQLSHSIYSTPQLVVANSVKIKEYAVLAPRDGFIKIGENSSINPFCVLLGYGGITIGSNVRIAAGSYLIAFNHNFDDIKTPIAKQGNNKKGIVVEDDVWIGAGVKILDGVTIGTGSVIGANSTVTKNIPPFSVAVGTPAKVIKIRYQ